MKIIFSKYHGTGNDFILMDDRDKKIHLSETQIEYLCDRRFGIGADGLILLKSHPGVDFEMMYYNADGKEGSMCGNGGRCITAFAKTLINLSGKATFSAIDGMHEAIIENESPMIVKLKMGDVSVIENNSDFIFVDTGSPHYVKFVNDVTAIDVVAEGRKIRYNDRFREKGTNVNFVQLAGEGLVIRTYERGVEDETLSCGTGVTASALAAVLLNKIKTGVNSIDVLTMGGGLKVSFEKNGSGFKNIWLEGEATFVYKGEVEI